MINQFKFCKQLARTTEEHNNHFRDYLSSGYDINMNAFQWLAIIDKLKKINREIDKVGIGLEDENITFSYPDKNVELTYNIYQDWAEDNAYNEIISTIDWILKGVNLNQVRYFHEDSEDDFYDKKLWWSLLNTEV